MSDGYFSIEVKDFLFSRRGHLLLVQNMLGEKIIYIHSFSTMQLSYPKGYEKLIKRLKRANNFSFKRRRQSAGVNLYFLQVGRNK